MPGLSRRELFAAAHVQVKGEWNNDLMAQVVAPTQMVNEQT